MAHVYENKPDARQSDEPITPSRFRPRYRPLTDTEKCEHDAIKSKATELESMIERLPPGTYKDQAMLALEESIMWAIKALTA
jgi:hypothetical protein